MRLWHFAVISAVALLVAACEQKKPEPTAHTDATTTPPAAQTPPPVTLDPYATDPYATDLAAQPAGTGVAQKPVRGTEKESTLIAGGSQRTHTVQKGDTLYSLARKYYNDPKRWKDIWEANKSVVPDKDKLTVGTKLVIP